MPIILILAEGRPRTVTLADNLSAATIMAYFSGNETGEALADILFGDINPSGKLPFTYPRYANALINYYRKNPENGNPDDHNGYNPLYEFGYGVSFTTFKYSNLRLDRAVLKDDEDVIISIDVTNTGTREGKEAVLMYISDLYASIAPDTKRLRAYSKINLKRGETKAVSFKINANDLNFINGVGKSVTEPGEFKIQIADQSQKFYYQTTVNFKAALDGKL